MKRREEERGKNYYKEFVAWFSYPISIEESPVPLAKTTVNVVIKTLVHTIPKQNRISNTDIHIHV